MPMVENALSVTQTASLCRVGRTTIGYWIRKKKLHANRVGRNYSIPVEELLFFLKSTGQKIPDELAKGNLRGPSFRTIQNCWQFWQGSAHVQNCNDCIVFKNQLETCFTARGGVSLCGSNACDECLYYQETYLSRIKFIHQIDLPAGIFRELCFWGGNRRLAELCGIQEKDLVGMGIERMVHPESLEAVISDAKKMALGDTRVVGTKSIFLKKDPYGKIRVFFSAYPLSKPVGAFLMLSEPE